MAIAVGFSDECVEKGIAMPHRVTGFALAALTLLGLGATAAPARADFFTLEGRFQCLDHANAVCGDGQILVPPPQPVVAVKPAPVVAPPATLEVPPPLARRVTAPVAPRDDDPLRAIAQRVKSERPSSGDLAWLQQAAKDGNPRAIELLAWCKLNAIGTGGDAVEAYLLYGAAATAAVPNARENQTLIYENDLSPDQRQQVLDLANEGVALAQLSPIER